MTETFLTKTNLARLKGIDVRSKTLRRLLPDAFLLVGRKRLGLYRQKQPLVGQGLEQVTTNKPQGEQLKQTTL